MHYGPLGDQALVITIGASIDEATHRMVRAVVRAIETRSGVVRSANTGISGYIDPLGRVQAATGLFVPAAEVYRAQTSDAISPFIRFGDRDGWGSVAASAVLVAHALRQRRAERRAAATRA
jgi:apolipoprotein N-acyltransferase